MTTNKKNVQLLHLSSRRFLELNRTLYGHEFGTDAGRVLKHWPDYDEALIGERLKELIPQLDPRKKL